MNQQDEINNLKKEVDELKQLVRTLYNASTIPREIEQSLVARGFVETEKPDYPDAVGDFTTNEGFRQTITVPAEGATISVPQFPVRFLELKDGSGLYIPLHAYFEFF